MWKKVDGVYLKVVEKNSKPNDDKKEKPQADIAIGGPITLWVGLVLIAGIFQLVLYPLFQSSILSPWLSSLNVLASAALYIPGIFILPVLAALWLGHRAGITEGSSGDIAYRGAINAIYASVVYLIVVFMLYIVSESLQTGILSTLPMVAFMEYIIAIPVLVVLVIAPLFGVISSARRY